MKVDVHLVEPYTFAPPPLQQVEDNRWQLEPWDRFLPASAGFVRDFVYGTRGIESPTAFCLWSALWAVSAAVRRGAWVSMYPKRMYPNLYVVFVAPPALCKKGTAINFAAEVLRHLTDFIQDETLKRIKEVRMVMNKVTPEGLVKRIRPLELLIEGEEQPLDLGSQMVVVAPELSVLMGKQTYNTGLIELLLDLYDCPEYWEYTKSGGQDGTQAVVIPIRKGFISMIAASTPDGLSMSVPETAFGDGFMSRLIPVFQDKDTRVFADPFKPAGAPSQEELSKRLSWICVNQVGEYSMSKEAHDWWVHWYETEFTHIRRSLSDKDARSRFDVTLRKLSLVMRLQRYEEGGVIELKDVLDAKRVLDATYSMSMKATEDVGVSDFMKRVRLVEKRLICRGSRTRRQLLTQIRGWKDALECTTALQHLHDVGRVKIFLNGKETHKATSAGSEAYLIGERTNEEEEERLDAEEERNGRTGLSRSGEHAGGGEQPADELLDGVEDPAEGEGANPEGVRKAKKRASAKQAVGLHRKLDTEQPEGESAAGYLDPEQSEWLLVEGGEVVHLQEEVEIEVATPYDPRPAKGTTGAFLGRRQG